MATAAPISQSNNNPGAIMYAPWETAYGAVPGSRGSGGQLAYFPSAAQGFAAAVDLQNTYQNSGHQSIAERINRWSPPNAPGNTPAATQNYINHISAAMGIDPNTPFDINDPTLGPQFLAAQMQFEAGTPQPFSQSDLQSGFQMAAKPPNLGAGLSAGQLPAPPPTPPAPVTGNPADIVSSVNRLTGGPAPSMASTPPPVLAKPPPAAAPAQLPVIGKSAPVYASAAPFGAGGSRSVENAAGDAGPSAIDIGLGLQSSVKPVSDAWNHLVSNVTGIAQSGAKQVSDLASGMVAPIKQAGSDIYGAGQAAVSAAGQHEIPSSVTWPSMAAAGSQDPLQAINASQPSMATSGPYQQGSQFQAVKPVGNISFGLNDPLASQSPQAAMTAAASPAATAPPSMASQPPVSPARAAMSGIKTMASSAAPSFTGQPSQGPSWANRAFGMPGMQSYPRAMATNPGVAAAAASAGYQTSPFTPSGAGWHAPNFSTGSGGANFAYHPNGQGGGTYINSMGQSMTY